MQPEDLPEFIWRISKYEDLGGRGGLLVDGRWHSRPKCVVYCASEPHTAFLEILRQYEEEMLLPDSLKMLKIKVPNRAHMSIVRIEELDPAWSDEISGYPICQQIGDEWLRSMRTPLLSVPSVVGDGKTNILINPAHPDITEFSIIEIIPQPFPDFIRAPEFRS